MSSHESLASSGAWDSPGECVVGPGTCLAALVFEHVARRIHVFFLVPLPLRLHRCRGLAAGSQVLVRLGSTQEGRGPMSGMEDVSGASRGICICECDASFVNVEVSLPEFGCDTSSCASQERTPSWTRSPTSSVVGEGGTPVQSMTSEQL